MQLPHRVRDAWPGLKDTFQPEGVRAATVPCRELHNEQLLRSLLTTYAATYPDANRAAVASQWSMDYLCVVLPVALVPPLVGGIGLDLKKDPLAVIEHGKFIALTAMGLKRLEPPRLSCYLDHLLENQIEPVFSCLSEVSRLSGKVLWTNFVVVWDSVFERLKFDHCRQGAIQAAHDWFDAAAVPAGSRRLRGLQHPTDSPVPDLCPQWLLRAHCCLHFQLEKSGPPIWCEACPKLRQLPLEEQVRYLRQLRMDAVVLEKTHAAPN